MQEVAELLVQVYCLRKCANEDPPIPLPTTHTLVAVAAERRESAAVARKRRTAQVNAIDWRFEMEARLLVPYGLGLREITSKILSSKVNLLSQR